MGISMDPVYGSLISMDMQIANGVLVLLFASSLRALRIGIGIRPRDRDSIIIGGMRCP